jgi:hypothetical protein
MLVLVALGLGLAACGGSRAAGGQAAAPGTLVASTSAPPAARRAGPPPALAALEASAEAVGEAAGTGVWGRAGEQLRQARAAWARLRPEVLARGAAQTPVIVIDGALDRLGADLARRADLAAAVDANAVTLALADLADLYPGPVPSDALRLDGRLREVQLAGRSGRWPHAASALAQAEIVWMRLRLTVIARPGPTPREAAGDLDDAMGATRGAVLRADAADLQTATARALDLVDRVEALFR